MKRFRVKLYDRAESFVLRIYSVHELLNQTISIDQFLSTEKTIIVFSKPFPSINYGHRDKKNVRKNEQYKFITSF